MAKYTNELMSKMNALLVSMSVNMYSQNGSTDWRQRPECSHILSQLQTICIKPVIQENECKLLETFIDRNCDILYKIFVKSRPNCVIRMANENLPIGKYKLTKDKLKIFQYFIFIESTETMAQNESMYEITDENFISMGISQYKFIRKHDGHINSLFKIDVKVKRK